MPRVVINIKQAQEAMLRLETECTQSAKEQSPLERKITSKNSIKKNFHNLQRLRTYWEIPLSRLYRYLCKQQGLNLSFSIFYRTWKKLEKANSVAVKRKEKN